MSSGGSKRTFADLSYDGADSEKHCVLFPPLHHPRNMSAGSKRAFAEFERDGPSSAVADERRVEPRTADNASGAVASGSAFPPPVARLHRHALESVFSSLTLRELHGVLSVSRDWQAAVMLMRPITARAFCPAVPALLVSRLRRHLFHLEIPYIQFRGTNLWNGVSAPQLIALTEQMPLLRSLKCDLLVPYTGDVLAFPAGLESVSLYFRPSEQNESQMVALGNAVLAALLPLTQLREVCLSGINSNLSLAPLQRMPALRELELGWNVDRGMSDAQAADLRQVRQLERLWFEDLSHDAWPLQRLLAESPSFSLRFLHGGDGCWLYLREEAAVLLPRLPLLSELLISFDDPRSLCHLAQLPDLRKLALRLPAVSQDARLMSCHLRACSGLQSLQLTRVHAGFFQLTSAQLAHAVAGMPQLQTLHLSGVDLGSLAFLAHGTLPHTLTELSIRCIVPQLLAADFVHVHGLKQLQSLSLEDVLAAPLSATALAQLTPPTALLPMLQFSDLEEAYQPIEGDANEDM